jgi:hypothetical protein
VENKGIIISIFSKAIGGVIGIDTKTMLNSCPPNHELGTLTKWQASWMLV